jgi:gliding motility-associated-like protein
VSYSAAQADCIAAMFGCTIGNFTTNSTGIGQVNDLPNGNNISNPNTNPGTAGNAGCLLSNEVNPTWIIFTVSSPGYLEFTLGSPGGNGFYDWSLWPYYQAGSSQSISGNDACADIQNNLLAPVACNWNGASAGFTGMVEQGNLPPGGNQVNFENSFLVNTGDQFVLCFSNFSGLIGQNVPVYTGADIPNSNGSNPADITCNPSAIGETVCLGDTATISIDTSGLVGITYNFLNFQSDYVDINGPGPDFEVIPSDSTTYQIEVTDTSGFTDTLNVNVYVVLPPTPNAGVDQIVCNSSQTIVNGVSSSSSSTVEWIFTGPGNLIFTPNNTSPTANVFSTSTGVYSLTFIEDNGVCPADSSTMGITFESPTINLSSSAPDCFGGSNGEIYVDAPLADSFSFDNGVTWQVDSFATGFSAGTYTVCIETPNDCQVCDDVIIVDGVQVQLTTPNDTTICQNGTATLTAQAIGGNTFGFLWNHTNDTVNSVQVTPNAQTTYTVQAENENGCLSPQGSTVVNVLPPLDGTVSATQTICPGESAFISATATDGNGGPYSFVWTDDAGNNVGVGGTISVAPNTTATYTVTITDGCESTPFSLTTTVEVTEVPLLDFSVDVDAQCNPAEFTITNTTDPSLVDQAFWYISDGQTFTNTDQISVNIDQAGSYDVRLVVITPNGCIDSIQRFSYLTVHPLPRASFTYGPQPVTMLNTEVSFQNNSSGAENYQWSFEKGDPGTSVSENPTVSFPEAVVDNYFVNLVAISEFGCLDTASMNVIVESEVILYAPNTFTPDGDQYNEQWRVFIEGVDIQDFELLIFDRWGELIWESKDPAASWDGTYGAANADQVPTGTYVWQIRTSDAFTDKRYEWQGQVTVLK